MELYFYNPKYELTNLGILKYSDKKPINNSIGFLILQILVKLNFYS